MADDVSLDNTMVVYLQEDKMIEMVMCYQGDEVNPLDLPSGHDYIAPPVPCSITIRKAKDAPVPDSPPRVRPQRELNVKSIDTPDGNHKCSECGFTTASRATIRKHVEAHQRMKRGAEFEKCTECDVDSKKKSKISANRVQCPLCSFFTTKEQYLRVHMNIHNRERPYKCVDCDFYGVTLKELSVHYRNHAVKEKRFMCDVCPYTAHTKERYASHYRTHTGEKPNKCSLCSYAANDRANLYKHMRKHAKDTQAS